MDTIAISHEALKQIEERGIVIREGWYDERQKQLHITLWPLPEYPEAHSDDGMDVERAEIQITIFSTTDQPELKEEIKTLMRAAGACYLGTDQQQTRIESGVFIRPLRFAFYEEKE